MQRLGRRCTMRAGMALNPQKKPKLQKIIEADPRTPAGKETQKLLRDLRGSRASLLPSRGGVGRNPAFPDGHSELFNQRMLRGCTMEHLFQKGRGRSLEELRNK